VPDSHVARSKWRSALDKRILRLIAKWLKVGIIEDGRVNAQSVRRPARSGDLPTLANAYLHYAYYLWVHRWRQTKATGDMIVVRFADDSAPRRREEEVSM
jgi:RNA-directed DNA polymerase